MTTRRWLFAIWLCFVGRTAFYSAAFPLWEGFDEWSHYSVISRIALRGEVLVSRESPVPRDVTASLAVAPLPWEMRGSKAPSVTQDVYWRLAEEERSGRESAFRSIPNRWAFEDSAGDLETYEALQPPLYAWMMAPLLRAAIWTDLPTRVLLLRWAGVLIGSLTIPFVFLIARSALRSSSLALGCAAIVAVMPQFAIDIARVGNECVSVALFSLLTWLVLEGVTHGISPARSAGIGVVLGLGLLAKAYFLAAAPAVILLSACALWRKRVSPAYAAKALALIIGASLLIAGWWYGRNLQTTGTLSGLSEAVMLRETPPGALIAGIAKVHWRNAVDTILFSHLWFGGWSSLTVRSWMYHVFYGIIAASFIGLVLSFRQRTIAALAAIYGIFWIAQLYNVLLLFVSKGLSGSMGWYMYAVVAAEVVLCTAGLSALLPLRHKEYVTAAGAALFAALDLYTIHFVALPYYTGLIAHRPNGTLAAFHLHDLAPVGLGGALTRVTAYKSNLLAEPLMACLWAGYAVGTIALVAIVCLARCPKPARAAEPAPTQASLVA